MSRLRLDKRASSLLLFALTRAGGTLLIVVVAELSGCGGSSGDSVGLSAGEVCDDPGEVLCPAGCGALCAVDISACGCTASSSTMGDTTAGTATGSDGTMTSSDGTTTGSDGLTMGSDGLTMGSDGTTSGDTMTSGTTTSGTTTSGTTSGDDSTGDSSSTGTTTMGWQEAQHVHIDIDNFCQVSVDPPEIWVPADEIVELTYHNHSVDYQADVWLSYGGGYLELGLGANWEDPFQWCSGPNASLGYADISIPGGGNNSCPAYQFNIHCE